jgi:hypothetical protein
MPVAIACYRETAGSASQRLLVLTVDGAVERCPITPYNYSVLTEGPILQSDWLRALVQNDSPLSNLYLSANHVSVS